MNKVIDSIKLSFDELRHKVTWPSWDELQESSVVTLVASLIIALLVFGMDVVFEFLMKIVYDLF
ncbi:MAG: preprotein translocase subunit SecE [Bacteroidetes bacterium]|jgi:preprotein translocase subunit SecE|nr:preprotein translocase subunit SecE [Bacteroidota bacterium]